MLVQIGYCTGSKLVTCVWVEFQNKINIPLKDQIEPQIVLPLSDCNRYTNCCLYCVISYKIKLKGNYKVEYPILALKSEIEELKDAATIINTKDIIPGEGISRICEINNCTKNPSKNGQL